MKRYQWAAAGDINAFFGLMLDNLAALVLAVGLLAEQYHFPANFALRYMVPGTALGVLFGDLVYTWMAFRLARRMGRTDVTAMPLGLDTPSTFGMVFFVLGPAFQDASARGLEPNLAAWHAWQMGICALIFSGLFKLVCSLGSSWIRRALPRAGLLGSLAAIALVLISFLPLMDILDHPVVGLVSLAIILTALVARVELPGRIPGALAALLVGSLIYYLQQHFSPASDSTASVSLPAVWLPTEWLSAWQLDWLRNLKASIHYLPVVIPFALATVVGGIDCTESAAAAGDEYHTGHVIAVEGLATLVAGLCGGVIQTTPYIGHPAYKAMGGRSAYTLATALFIGSAGLLGYFGILYALIPKAAIFPILIFVGLEITAQSFHATPRRHFAAVALACLPAMAYLVTLSTAELRVLLGEHARIPVHLADRLQTMQMLANGFIVTSLLWGSALAALIDRRLRLAACFFAIAAGCSLFGVIHSPLPGGALVVPWDLPKLSGAAARQSPIMLATAYGGMALVLVAWSFWRSAPQPSDRSEPGELRAGES